MKAKLGFVLLAMLLLSGSALAQGAPIGNGVYACDGAAQAGPCQPDADSYGDAPAASPVRWQDRWGAIATDARNAKIGAVTDMPNERKAKSAALKACQQNGGVDCSVEIAYYNQCAVLVTGEKLYNTSRGPTIESATEYAMNVCAKGDRNCRLYYSGCSLPVQVQ